MATRPQGVAQLGTNDRTLNRLVINADIDCLVFFPVALLTVDQAAAKLLRHIVRTKHLLMTR